VRDIESLEQLTRVRLRVAGEREEHVLRPDVRRAELAGFVVGGEQRGFRVGRQRRCDVGALGAIRLLLDLRGNRVGIGVDLPQYVAHDVVVQCGVEQMIGVEVEAAPVERRVRGALQQLARRVAEELRDVDPLDLPFARRSGKSTPGAAVRTPRPIEEVREEVVEQAAAASEPTRQPFFREVDLAEVLGLLCPVRQKLDSGRDGRPPVAPTSVLNRHREPPNGSARRHPGASRHVGCSHRYRSLQ
jgi:hypothetical protein